MRLFGDFFKRGLRLDSAQKAYLAMLKAMILNNVYYHGPHLREGTVWPDHPALSMVGEKRLNNVEELTLKCLSDNVPGDFIEAGIWKGGVVALMAGILKITGTTRRKVFGVDSFEGIPPAKPDIYPADAAHVGCENLDILKKNSLEEVTVYLDQLGLSFPYTQLIKGWFSDILPGLAATHQFALVRIDGDTYESTFQALEALGPAVSRGGYIIIDDYYSWEGCRKATEDYRICHNITASLVQIDWTGVYWQTSR
ncbi:TylF/MycF family methyltransferase [Termitidicoccus mucosus]|uniref:Macrocin O-methyltransferase n=1 Tax=Termitidicoccus mucosus TaxID=1184151 RepID=A0A178IK15_9BACT|nr:hypothetical protein AW736_12615 [Opitutaceae bacterium TSB47]